jgi:hypothetical protein
MYFGPAVYVLHVQLNEVEPPIWRRVVVEEATKLPKLSRILEAAMGWDGYHLHHFEIGDGVIFSDPDPDADYAIDERKVTVKQILPRDGATLVWQYDFGDSWDHTVTVEARNEPDPHARYPQVLDGARACPPEDCGGTYGYADLLETLADPSHPEHDHMVQWAPDGFDPEAFDVQAHDAAVRKVR